MPFPRDFKRLASDLTDISLPEARRNASLTSCELRSSPTKWGQRRRRDLQHTPLQSVKPYSSSKASKSFWKPLERILWLENLYGAQQDVHRVVKATPSSKRNSRASVELMKSAQKNQSIKGADRKESPNITEVKDFKNSSTFTMLMGVSYPVSSEIHLLITHYIQRIPPWIAFKHPKTS